MQTLLDYRRTKLLNWFGLLLLNRKQLTTVFSENYIKGSDQQTNAVNSGLVKTLKLIF